MKILKLTVLVVVTMVVMNGCNIGEIKSNQTNDTSTGVENNTTDSNISDNNSTIEENLTNSSEENKTLDTTPIVIHDGSGQQTSNQSVSTSQTTTSSSSTSGSIITDPNACDLTNYISDDNNEPQGVTKDGIKFTSKLSNASEVLTFYYEKNADEKAGLDAHLGDFYDENDTLMFSLSINEAYFNKGYFYIKNEYTGKCYRGSFPPNEMTPPSKIVQEVSKE